MIISQAKQLIKFGLKHRFQYLFIGQPGIGKTEMMIQVAQEEGWKIMLFHPVVDEPTDYKGLPWIVDGKAKFIPYSNLETMIDAEENTLCFFDDLGQAGEDIEKPLMHVFQDRQINGHKISEKVCFMAATNRREDMAGVTGMIEPLKSRFDALINIEYDHDDHMKWMIDNQMPVDLIAFNRFQSTWFDNFKPTRDLVNQPTPRTVAKLGMQIKSGLPDELFFEVGSGSVGSEYALAYSSFRNTWKKLPNPELVITSPETAPMPDVGDENGLSAMYAISGMVASRATEINADNMFKYIDRMPEQFQVLTVKDMINYNPSITSTSSFINWTVDNQELFGAVYK